MFNDILQLLTLLALLKSLAIGWRHIKGLNRRLHDKYNIWQT